MIDYKPRLHIGDTALQNFNSLNVRFQGHPAYKGEAELGVICISMSGGKVLRADIKKLGKINSKKNRPHTAALRNTKIEITIIRSFATNY